MMVFNLFKFFQTVVNSLSLHNNNNNNNKNEITGYKPEYLQSSLAQIISNLANDRVSIKFNKSVSMQQSPSSLYNQFILSSYMVYNFNNLQNNPNNNFILIFFCLGPSN